MKVLMRRQGNGNSKVLLIEMLNGIATLEYHVSGSEVGWGESEYSGAERENSLGY